MEGKSARDSGPAGAPAAPGQGHSEQSPVLAFLADPGSWSPRPERVDHVETHGAHVFMAGEQVLKIKRAVRYSYMDFSTLDRRKAACARELEVNSRFAPNLYLGLTPITRESDGGLRIGGQGEVVEWAVAMRRFEERAVLSRIARRGPLGAAIIKPLAAAVFASHRHAEAGRRPAACEVRRLVLSLARDLATATAPDVVARADGFRAAAGRILDAITPLLDKRGSEGRVRRCHGDLHLNNIVLIEGRPTLFDALEFDETLATVDVLYDLGFLLMDLDAAGHRTDANLLLARYAWLDGTTETLEGLAALPLFLALRAAVRAVVGLQRAAAAPPDSAPAPGPSPAAYMRHALDYLEPPPPRLVAIGGFSGTGKSTLGAALAPTFGAAPGALHLRSDLERKSLFGVGETGRLPGEAYTPEAGEAVYSRLLSRAGTALKAGHSVIVDAVFADGGQRKAVETVARQAGAGFQALWLTVTPETAASRIRMRRGDASDATPEVAMAQMKRGAGDVSWRQLATDDGAEATFRRALALIPPDPADGTRAAET